MTIEDIFRVNLNNLIQERGFTHNSAAMVIGMSQSHLTKLLNGDTCPMLRTVQNICEKMGVDPIAMMEEEDT